MYNYLKIKGLIKKILKEARGKIHFTYTWTNIKIISDFSSKIIELSQLDKVHPWQSYRKFSPSVISDSLRPRGLQHTRLPCPSPSPGACSNSCPSVGDAIQLSYPLLSYSPPVFNLFQYQVLFQWVSSSQQGTKVLELQLQLQHQSFQWIFRTDFL